MRTGPGRPRARAHIGAALAVGAALVLAAAACGSSTPAPSQSSSTQFTVAGSVVGGNAAAGPFYQPADPLPAAKPGDIIRSQPMAGAPDGAQAYLVLYHSTSIDGADIAVSGMIIVPSSPAPAGGRPVVAWGHPTTGVADQCAPSLTPLGFTILPGLSQFLAAGYVVAATDYEGLGTPGVHPYLVGESEGRGVLDSARAAGNLPAASASKQTLLWGWSQGGQASLFAGQLAPTYAPELEVKGVAAAAPAGELSSILKLSEGTQSGVSLGGYAITAYANVYAPTTPGLDVATVVTPEGQQILPTLVTLCNLTQAQQVTDLTTPVVGHFYAGDPTTAQPWASLLQKNVPGADRTPVPMYIAQGTADTTVPPQTAEELAQSLCASGDQLQLQPFDGGSHETIGFASAPDVATWFAQRLAGAPATPNCSALPPLPSTNTGSAPGSTPPGTPA
jgi:pimeloyl-ACP methyl ester carboxylesterase